MRRGAVAAGHPGAAWRLLAGLRAEHRQELIALGRSTVDLGPTVAGPDPIVARSLRRLALAQFGLVGVLGLAVLCGLVRPYGATGEVWALLVLLRRRRLRGGGR